MSTGPLASPAPQPPGPAEALPSTRTVEVELTEPLPAVRSPGRRLWVLARLASEPIGVGIFRLGEAELTPDRLGELLWAELETPVTERFRAAGLARPDKLTGRGLAAGLRLREAHPAATQTAPFISVVVCTRDRAACVRVCLEHLARQDYPSFEVVVVENVPTGDAVRELVDARASGAVPFRYVAEERPGLSWARNAGVAASAADLIAFLDDDDEPDRLWLAGIARGFARGGDIACVTGVTLASRLETRAQEMFEELGGHSTGRGFTPAIFSRRGPQSPLFPLPPFGAGANMAFRREALKRIGGFDVALGAGTPTATGEDTLAFTLVLLAGYRIAYEPSALMRHTHRRDADGLRSQLRGYSIGLYAYYAALLRHRPDTLPCLLRLLPAAVRHLRTGRQPGAVSADLPDGVGGLQLKAMLKGPAAYVRSVCVQARVAKGGWP